MATRDGEEFIGEQLVSIAAQEGVTVELWISDDGSSDRTLEKITDFMAAHPALPVRLLKGPQAGFVRNFLSMVCNRDLDAPYLAFSDQDDVWHPDKLRVAVDALAHVPPGVPALYTSRTRTVGNDGEIKGCSAQFRRAPSLENALVQSIGGGNTMVFDDAVRRLLICAGSDVDVQSHDWWTYLAATSCGGFVVYDPEPHIDYRQHEGNIVGENSSLTARILRVNMLLKGQFRDWLDRNLDALQRIEPQMTPQARAKVEAFRALRKKRSPLARLRELKRLGLYRQTPFGTISMNVAAFLNRL